MLPVGLVGKTLQRECNSLVSSSLQCGNNPRSAPPQDGTWLALLLCEFCFVYPPMVGAPTVARLQPLKCKRPTSEKVTAYMLASLQVATPSPPPFPFRRPTLLSVNGSSETEVLYEVCDRGH